jgi:hypothetical protein
VTRVSASAFNIMTMSVLGRDSELFPVYSPARIATPCSPAAVLVQYARTGRLETLAMQAFTSTDERICTEIDNFSFARRLPTR